MSDRHLLLLDTATETVAVGVAVVEATGRVEVLSDVSRVAPRKANTVLLSWVLDALSEAGCGLSEVDGIAVGRGPGSFTGVRIGVATAKGLAHGLGSALWGVSTLDAIAWSAAIDGEEGVLGVVGDAMRGEVYPALFELTGGRATRLSPDRVATPQTVAREWAEGAGVTLVAGNGLAKHAAIFAEHLPDVGVLPESLWHPDATGLAAAWVADRSALGWGTGDPATVLPVYTRLSDAEEAERERSGLPRVPPPVSGVAGDGGGLVVRPLRPEDVEAVVAIEAASFDDPWTDGMFADDLQAPDRAWVVAEQGGEVVGYAGVAMLGDEAHLLNLAVREDKRRQGIGRALFARASVEAAVMGAEKLTLECRAGNTAAIALYESMGMESAGVRPGYYARTGEDAVIMWGQTGARDAAGGAAVQAGPEVATPTRVDPPMPARAAMPPGEARYLLAIETSCDETAAAVVTTDGELIANVVASQVDFHARFGGVVPEIASRKHTEAIVGVVDEALEKAGEAAGAPGVLPFAALDAIAVTYGPGLVGALVVGLAYAKGLSLATGVPLVGVNHLEGHIFANVLADPDVKPPLVALVVSGGHTSLVHMPEWGVYRTMGETLDDAAGEAFDKVAKVLGLGYPGGPVLSRMAAEGNPAAIDFPRAMMRSGDYAFSLSGLKTAVINHIRHEQEAGREIDIPDLAASFQAAIVDVQVAKAVRAVQETGAKAFCLAGGVAANPALREALREAIEPLGVHVSVPPMQLCTDNAAMIAAAALPRLKRGEFLGLDAEAVPGLRLDNI